MYHFKPLVFVLGLTLISPALAQQGSKSNAAHSIEAALRAGESARALELVESELQRSPKDATLLALKGIALSRLGRDKEALSAYNGALNISPDYLAALEGAAELEYKAGSSRAVPLLNRIVKLRPEDEEREEDDDDNDEPAQQSGQIH